ncbi:MAG: hypothetical protein R3F05_14470 [Planctomycetota bacterium]
MHVHVPLQAQRLVELDKALAGHPKRDEILFVSIKAWTRPTTRPRR